MKGEGDRRQHSYDGSPEMRARKALFMRLALAGVSDSKVRKEKGNMATGFRGRGKRRTG